MPRGPRRRLRGRDRGRSGDGLCGGGGLCDGRLGDRLRERLRDRLGYERHGRLRRRRERRRRDRRPVGRWLRGHVRVARVLLIRHGFPLLRVPDPWTLARRDLAGTLGQWQCDS